MIEQPNIHDAVAEPELGAMRKELQSALADASYWYDRNEHALNVRYCWWPGQHRDGRKWSGVKEGSEPFPWKGASDARIRTVDMIINEKVDLLMTTLERMNVQATPTKAQDQDWSSRMALLLRWYLSNAMADERDGEVEPLANYMLTYGSAVLAVHWLQTLAYELKEVKLEELQAAAQQSGLDPAALGALLFDPALRDQAIALVQKFSSMLTKAQARKVISDLQTLGTAKFNRPFVDQSRPSLTALQVFQDVFFPPNTQRLQRSRWVAQREFLNETELREKVEGIEQWDADFVEKVIATCKGRTFNANIYAMNVMERQREVGGVWGTMELEAKDLYEIWHLYHRAQQDGIPAIFRTVFSPVLGDDHYALHELCPYAHGEFPFIEFVRERHVKEILASRGLPEVLDTQQTEIKTQRDARTDRASVSTFPPMKRKASMGSNHRKLVYGPGVEIPVLKMDELEPLTLGAPDMTSIQVEQATIRDVNEYAGRRMEGLDPGTADKSDQALVSRWLRRWQRAGRQMLALAQQYTPPQTIPRVVGMIPKPVDISREAIAGEFDLILTFDARMANDDFLFSMMERLEQYVLPMDTNATVDRDVLIRWIMAGINPTLADLAVKDSASANVQELEDEQGNIAKMFAGQEPPMKLKGQNFGARLQVLQQAVQNPRIMALAQQWPDFGQMIQRRAEFLHQQVNQQQNRLIGVYGTTPSAGSAGVPVLGGMGSSGGG